MAESPPMSSTPRVDEAGEEPTFALLVRRFRRAAGLTQEELAAQSTLSVRAIRDMERGVQRRPQRETLRLLADGLALPLADRALLEAAARRRHGTDAPPPTPLVTAAAALPTPPRWRLPASLTPLIGRERECDMAVARLRDGQARLLTLTGPGGVGKTRLAIEIARALRDAFSGGVCYVSLGTVRDPDLIAPTIAHALGVRERAGQTVIEEIIVEIGDSQLLLVLDNFEHLLGEAMLVTDLLVACPHLAALVTSRAALHVRGEHELPLAPLLLPDRTEPQTPETLASNPAVALFCQRALAVNPAFVLAAENAMAVADICTRLDGLPLALELAAAHARFLSPTALLARLTRLLPMLTSGPRDLPARQRTMRDTIAWSYEMLDDREQQLFRHLAVFIGGWTADAARAVIPGADEHNDDVWARLTMLAEKSLTRPRTNADGNARFRMLEVVREFAQEQLTAEEAETARDRHAAYFLAFAETAEPYLTGAEQTAWLERLGQDHDNLRAALRWVRARGNCETGLRIAGALWQFWQARSLFREGRRWLEDLLAQDASAGYRTPTSVRARALLGAGMLATRQDDNTSGEAYAAESLALYRQIGDRRGMALALQNLGRAAYGQQRYDLAMQRNEESLALRRELGDTIGVARNLGNMGRIARFQGDFACASFLLDESARQSRALGDTSGLAISLGNAGHMARDRGDWAQALPLIEESLALYQALDDKRGIAIALNQLALIAIDRRDDERGRTLCMQSLALRREMDDRWGIANSLMTLGDLAIRAGDQERATMFYREALALNDAITYRPGVAECLERLGQIASADGHATDAARWFGAAERIRSEIGAPRIPVEEETFTRATASVRMMLGDDGYAEAIAEGEALAPKQVHAEASDAALARHQSQPALPPPNHVETMHRPIIIEETLQTRSKR